MKILCMTYEKILFYKIEVIYLFFHFKIKVYFPQIQDFSCPVPQMLMFIVKKSPPQARYRTVPSTRTFSHTLA